MFLDCDDWHDRDGLPLLEGGQGRAARELWALLRGIGILLCVCGLAGIACGLWGWMVCG